MNLQTHFTGAPGYTELVSPRTHPTEYLCFGVLRLAVGESYQLASDADEIGLVILSGACDVRINEQELGPLGGRQSVFDGRGTGVYVPRDATCEVRGVGSGASTAGVEIAVCRCRTDARHPVRVVHPADVVVHEVGGPGFKRYVHDILGAQMQAGAMIVGETYTVAGNWSSYPPHKHDVAALPDEVQQEELYFYKLRPADGFGIQYIYSRADSPRGALEAPLAVRENDVTVIPYGYHPVAAPPGYDVYYLWFLSGPARLMRPHDDAAYAWVKSNPTTARSYPQ